MFDQWSHMTTNRKQNLNNDTTDTHLTQLCTDSNHREWAFVTTHKEQTHRFVFITQMFLLIHNDLKHSLINIESLQKFMNTLRSPELRWNWFQQQWFDFYLLCFCGRNRVQVTSAGSNMWSCGGRAAERSFALNSELNFIDTHDDRQNSSYRWLT